MDAALASTTSSSSTPPSPDVALSAAPWETWRARYIEARQGHREAKRKNREQSRRARCVLYNRKYSDC